MSNLVGMAQAHCRHHWASFDEEPLEPTGVAARQAAALHYQQPGEQDPMQSRTGPGAQGGR